MKLSDFERDILDPMDSHITTFDRMRVWVAYQDVVNLFDLITMLDHWIGGRIQKLYEIGSEQYEVLALDARVGSLHKALIEFANIFMTILIHEAQQRPVAECTLGKLAVSPKAVNLDNDVLHQAYCLYIYRNKVIAHHKVPRSNARLMDADGTRRLMPAPHHSISQTNVQNLLALQQKYAAHPGVAHQTNPYELLNALYYSVPSPHGSKVSSDRELINQIAERGGSRSLSPAEIITTIDDFSREIAHLAPL